MENLFEAQYIRTEADHKAWFSYLFWKRPVILVLNCVLALGFIANLISLIIFVEEIFYVRLLVPLYFALQILNYCRAVKTAVARDKETFAGKPISIHIGINEDTIHYTFVDVRTVGIPLGSIKRAFFTKYGVFLLSEAKIVYALPAASFTKGTPAELKVFLSGKGIR